MLIGSLKTIPKHVLFLLCLRHCVKPTTCLTLSIPHNYPCKEAPWLPICYSWRKRSPEILSFTCLESRGWKVITLVYEATWPMLLPRRALGICVDGEKQFEGCMIWGGSGSVMGSIGFQEGQIALETLKFRISRILPGDVPSFSDSGFSSLTPGLAHRSQNTSPM